MATLPPLVRHSHRYSLNVKPTLGTVSFVPAVPSGMLMLIDIKSSADIFSDSFLTKANTGELVYAIKDLSGLNNHWTQPTSDKRATLVSNTSVPYLNFPTGASIGTYGYGFAARMTTIRTVFWAVKASTDLRINDLLGDSLTTDFVGGASLEAFLAGYAIVDTLRINKTAVSPYANRPTSAITLLTATTSRAAASDHFSQDRAEAPSSWSGTFSFLLCYNSVLSAQQISDTEDAIKTYLAI